MLDNIVKAATDLPVVIQGALGSALFALLLFLGQRLAAIASIRFAKSSRARRKTYLVEEQIKCNVMKSKDFAIRGALVTLLLYRAVRSLFRAFIWLTFGLIFGAPDGILGLVGYLGCIYYLFSGLNTVLPLKTTSDIEKRLEQIALELETLHDA